MISLALIGDIEFAYPQLLLLLALIPLLAIWLVLPRFRRQRQPTFLFSGAPRLAARHRGYRIYLRPVLDMLFVAGLALLVVALARPQIVEYEEANVEGIDIFIAFDMSGSMQAIDRSEEELRAMERRGESPKTRFEEAKQTLLDFLESRPHDRIGVVLFARDAFLQVPLTLDHELIRQQIDPLEIGDIDENGTAIGNAVGRTLTGLEDSEADTKISILITDGDRRGGNVSPMQAAGIAESMGVPIYPILVGTDGEALIASGRSRLSRRTAYRRVEFPVDPQLLQDMAEPTGGEYFRALDGRAMADDLNAILDNYDRTEIEDRGRTFRHERFQIFALLALLLISAHFLGHHTLCKSFP